MTDPSICPHDKFTATPDREHMECNECGRLFSADLYWGVYDQLEYGKDQGCGEEAIEVIQMVEDHFKEREQPRTQPPQEQKMKKQFTDDQLREILKNADMKMGAALHELCIKGDGSDSCPWMMAELDSLRAIIDAIPE